MTLAKLFFCCKALINLLNVFSGVCLFFFLDDFDFPFLLEEEADCCEELLLFWLLLLFFFLWLGVSLAGVVGTGEDWVAGAVFVSAAESWWFLLALVLASSIISCASCLLCSRNCLSSWGVAVGMFLLTRINSCLRSSWNCLSSWVVAVVGLLVVELALTTGRFPRFRRLLPRPRPPRSLDINKRKPTESLQSQ